MMLFAVIRTVLVCLLVTLMSGIVPLAMAATDPTLPTAVDSALLTVPTTTGTTYNATCATLQAQIDAAAAANINLNHEIILATGTLCTGPYVLRSHNGGTGWITIRGVNFASLPAIGTRVTSSDASLMPEVQYGEDGSQLHLGCFSAATGAQRYHVVGMNCHENTSFAINWVFFSSGYGHPSASNTGYIVFERNLLMNRAWATGTNARRGVYAEAENGQVSIRDNYISGIADAPETQAILVITNPGPILIKNNYLEATGENIMFCGGTPASSSSHPADITVQHNSFYKPSAWFGTTLGYTVKALFELKCGIRVLVEGNTFENMPYNDGGFVHRLTPRNDSYASGAGTFLEITDLTIRYNTYKNNTNWINTIASDDGSPCNAGVPCNTRHAKRWKIHSNLVYGLGKHCSAGADCGTIVYLTTGGGDNNGTNLTAGVRGSCTDPSPTCKHEDLQITHNTIDLSGTAYSGDNNGTGLLPITSDGLITLNYTDNLVNARNACSIYDHGNGYSSSRGTTRLNEAVSGPGRVGPVAWVFDHNRLAHLGASVCDSEGYVWSSSTMPTGNDYTTLPSNFQWTNACTAGDGVSCTGSYDYTLQAGSPAKNAASDGTDQGVNWTAFNAAQLGGGGGGGGSTPQPRFAPGINLRRAELPNNLYLTGARP